LTVHHHRNAQPIGVLTPRRATTVRAFEAHPGTWDLLNILATIAEKGTAGFRSLGDGWADGTTPHGRPMLTVLGGMEDFERELIQARGVRMGRKPKLTLYQHH
jgi:hypothetical protein